MTDHIASTTLNRYQTSLLPVRLHDTDVWHEGAREMHSACKVMTCLPMQMLTHDVPTDSDQVCKIFSQLQQVLSMVTRLKCSGVWSVARNIRVNIKMATVA